MIALLLVLAVSMAQAPEPTIRTIDKGDQSNIDEARQVVVRSEAEWSRIWTTHGGDRKKPAVNFDKEMVIGVFMGSRPSAGYTTTIVSTVSKDGKMIVRYEEKMPAKGTLTAQILTSPYHLVAAPKMAGEVKFERVP
jgi:protease stability complex PrcB-like protein